MKLWDERMGGAYQLKRCCNWSRMKILINIKLTFLTLYSALKKAGFRIFTQIVS